MRFEPLFYFLEKLCFLLFLTFFLTFFSLFSHAYHSRNGLANNFFPCSADMAIDIHCSSDIGMTKPFLNILRCHTLIDQHTGAAVAKSVNSQIRQPVFLDKVFEMVINIIRRKQLSIGPFENIVIFDIVTSQKVLIISFYTIYFGLISE